VDTPLPQLDAGRPGTTAGQIVGRGAELDAIDRFLERLAHGSAGLALEGLPGIGKTTVWRRVFERAAERSLVVLSCRAVEAEAKLAFASLADLLEPVAAVVLPRLPEPQRIALEVALMRASPQGAPPSDRAVATAVLSSLRILTETAPLVLAIDDEQWLDRASAEALAFALRRIGDRRVGVAVTVRVDDDRARDPLALDAALAERLERCRLGPLSLSALHHIIRAHVDHVFPRPALRRIADASGGNPFFALELARALKEAGAHPRPGEPLPVPDTLTSLIVHRLRRLPVRARAVLLLASAAAAPTVALLRRAVGVGDANDALARAEQARVLEMHEGRVRLTHPLLAAAVISSASPTMRRDAHRRLAALVTAPEERARHLALAAEHPDADVARALDEAAALARRRGAPDAAAELQEQAARLTPADDAAGCRRRRIQAAEHSFHAGDRAHARALIDGVLADVPVGNDRAMALHLLGQLYAREDAFTDAIGHLEEAIIQCDDPRASAAIRLDLASATYNAGDLRQAIAVSRDTLADAERLGDQGLIASALAMLVLGEFMLGLGGDRDRMARALALEDRERESAVLLRPTAIAGLLAVYEGRAADAEALLRRICDWARERGEESGIPFLLFNLSRLAWLRGDLATAVAYADDALLLADQIGSDRMHALAAIHRSRAHGMRGDVAAARADLADARAIIEKTGFMQGVPWLLASEGLLELSVGDAHAAEHVLEPLVALVEANGIREPMQAYYLPDAVEALVRLGDHVRAAALLEPFERRAREIDRPWAIANAVRCRSLLAADRGDLDTALALAEEAVERWQALELPIELGRALVVLGQVRRRRNERRLAGQVLERARSLFRDLGVRTWEDRAAEELRRVPLRRVSDDLTPTEEQVAMLAGNGRTNREVAKALFMSPKTVEANLARIYGKLGIRSRAELGARMLARGQARGRAQK
jgi:DNA-binding CsgD family transcriptional regulator